MQRDFRKLAKHIAKSREKIPEPIYKGMRLAYRKYGKQLNPRAPSEFNDEHYLQTNPYIDHEKLSPYDHFRKIGHKDLRNPNPDFDIVWYLQNYGHTFDVSKIDPFSHYLKYGKSRGNSPHPPRKVQFNKTTSKPLPNDAKRACLFAGYDPEGRIDEYVLIYLKELAKHADVFYLADCEMHETELAKLEGIVKGAWAKRHGAYDFGSYSLLARDFVGWSALSEYDEVVFANDSAYLVQPLDDTFARMNDMSIAWWGLHATKGLVSTRGAQPFPVADDDISMDDVRDNFLDSFEHDSIYDFHIGSYFMAFRKDIINDERFQRVINAVQPEKRKVNIVLKYEVGLTHFLIGHGYEFATFGQSLTRSHPVYSDVAFTLLENGFPLFKRYILSENHYKVSSISYWKTALTQAGSATSISTIENNYLRTSNADKLYRNFNIIEDGILPKPSMSAESFKLYDNTTPKYDNYWGFPVCAYDQNLSDNTRAVFESVKNDQNIQKIIFTRGRVIRPGGINVIMVPLLSHEGQTYLARCRNLFVKHGAFRNLHWPVNPTHHNIVNLWHGIPLKRIGVASLDLADKSEAMIVQNRHLRSVISSSDVDRLAMSSAFAPLPLEDIWLTGLPRHDFITKPEAELPDFLYDQLNDLRQLTAGRKMILFCPTFRNDQENGYYSFTQDQIDRLTDWLTKHDMILGVREHLNDKALQYSSQLNGDRFIPVQSGRFPDIEILYREAAMLITDYSSCFIDYMLTERPMISFAYDLDAYKLRERGLFYELEDVFPGPIVQDFDSLLMALGDCAKEIGSSPDASYEIKRKFFIKYSDSQNTERLVERVIETYEGSKLASGFVAEDHPKTPKSIVFLYSSGASITNRYRIFALISRLKIRGWTCHAMEIDHATIDVLVKAEFVSFCRQNISNRTRDLAELVRGTGGTVIYDTDVLVHDEDILSQSEYFLHDRKLTNKANALGRRTAEMMTLADCFTVTTPALLRSVEKYGKPAAIVENSISQSLLDKYAELPARNTSDQTHISYLSGTATHSKDFEECKSALQKVLSGRPNVVLHIVGPLNMGGLEEHLSDGQIQRHGFMPYAGMHAFLRTMDLNLAPLTDTAFNDAKSALKVFEAALHGVPTIASPSEPYRNAIQDRKTGFLARTEQEWHDALIEAVDHKTNRQKIGVAAKRTIVPAFTSDVAAQQLTDFLTKHA
ncbi:MAG: CDP-glycerol glycerophosphotransferase family protein [Litoreibacter sp.]